MYNALTDRKTDRPARFVSVFSARTHFSSKDFVGRGTAPILTASPLYFVYQNIFAASPVFPGKRLLSLPEFVPGNADSAEAQSCVFPESATMRTRSSCRASVVPTRSGFSESGVAA